MATKRTLNNKTSQLYWQDGEQLNKIGVFTLKQWFGRGIEGTARRYGPMKYVVGTWVEYKGSAQPECLATVSMHRNKAEAMAFKRATRNKLHAENVIR